MTCNEKQKYAYLLLKLSFLLLSIRHPDICRKKEFLQNCDDSLYFKSIRNFRF